MSEFSGMSKDDFEPLIESYDKSIYIDKKNEAKTPANTRETSKEDSKLTKK